MAGLLLELQNAKGYQDAVKNLDKVLTSLDKSFLQAARSGKEFDTMFSGSNRRGVTDMARAVGKLVEAFDRLDDAQASAVKKSGGLLSGLMKSLNLDQLAATLRGQGEKAGEGFLAGLRAKWGISSPSSVMAQLAGFLGAGFSAGIRSVGFGRFGSGAGDDFIDGFSKNLNNGAGKSLDKFKSTLASLLPGIGIGALLTGSFNAAKDFETAFAGVRKTLDTTGLSADEAKAFLADLEDQLRDLATAPDSVVAGIDNAQIKLANIAEAAGQLGIAREDIIAFTTTIAQLELTTDLAGETAATALAQFANLTGTREFDRLGATIVALGNDGASTESQIVEFAQRLAGAGDLAGLTNQEILALASTMASLGLNAEAGGSAFTQTLDKITKAVAEGGDELAAFSSIAGQSADDFAQKWRNDPVTAITDFVVGLSKLDSEQAVQALDNLGLDGLRVSDTLRRMAGNTDLLKNSLQTANSAWAENNALTNEAAQRFQTTQAQLNLLKNNVRDAGISLGQVLLPPVNAFVGALVPIIQGLADANPLVLQLAVGGGILFAAWTPLTGLFGALLAIVAGPAGLIIAAGALVVGFLKVSGIGDAIVGSLGRMVSRIGELISGARQLLALVGLASPTATGGGGTSPEGRTNQLLERRKRLLEDIAGLQAEAATSAASTQEITIQQGDTLSAIAAKYGTTVDELARLNNIQNRNLIITGQTLQIPVGVDTTDVTDKLDELTAEVQDIDAKLKLSADASQVETTITDLDAQISAFTQTDLFKSIFGDDPQAAAQFANDIRDARVEIEGIRANAGLAAQGIQQIFAGDRSGGLDTLRSGLQGLKDDLSDILNTFLSGGVGDTTFADSFGRSAALAAGGGGSALGSLGRRLFDNIIGDIQNVDLSEAQPILEQHMSTILKFLGLAIGVVFPPAGIVLGIGAAIAFAIENDIGGIRTFLEQSGVVSTIQDVVQSIRTAIDSAFNTVFGDGAVDAATFADTFGRSAALAGRNTTASNPIVQTISDIVNGAKNAVSQFGPELQESFGQIGSGISEFISNLTSANTDGLDDVVAFMIKLGGAIGAILGGIITTGVNVVGDVAENVLPNLGTAISGLITIISGIGEGDPAIVLQGIGDSIGGFLGVLVGFPKGVADGLIETINDLTGADIPNVDQIFTDAAKTLGDAFLAIRILFDNMQRDIGSFFDGIILEVVTRVGDLRQAVLDATGGNFDIAPQIGFQEGEIKDRIATREIADAIGSAIQEQLDAGGPINLTAPINLETENASVASNIQFLLSSPDIATSLSLEDQVKVQDAVRQAFEAAVASGDVATQEAALKIAPNIGLDLSNLTIDTAQLSTELQQLFDLGFSAGEAGDQLALVSGLETAIANQITTAFENGGQTALEQLDFATLLAGQDLNTEGLDLFGIDVGEAVKLGIVTGLTDNGTVASSSTALAADGIKAPIEAELGVQSPSTWGIEVGGFIVQGIQQGMLTNVPIIQSAVSAIVGMIKSIATESAGVGPSVAASFSSMAASASAAGSIIPNALRPIANELFNIMTNATNAKNALEALARTPVPSAQLGAGSSVPANNWTGGIFRGLSWVGEQGPELVSSDTNLAVLNNRTSNAFAAGMAHFRNTMMGARQFGGDILRGGMYRIVENGVSELAQIGNDLFLLPGANGFVTPLQPFAQAPGLGNGSIFNDNSTRGSTQIIINPPPGVSAQEIAVEVRDILSNDQRTNTAARRLIGSGRV